QPAGRLGDRRAGATADGFTGIGAPQGVAAGRAVELAPHVVIGGVAQRGCRKANLGAAKMHGVNQEDRLCQKSSPALRSSQTIFALTLSPDFRLIAETVDSTLLRW